MGSLAAVSRRTGFVMLTAEWGIAMVLSVIVRRLWPLYRYGKIEKKDPEAHHFRLRGSSCGREPYNG